MGSGHLMRCLTLADELNKNSSVNIFFISRNHKGNINRIVKQRNFRIIELPTSKNKITEAKYDKNLYGIRWLGVSQEEDANEFLNAINCIEPDLLIIDHYGIGEKWETLVRKHVKKIMVVDDLANRIHDCDFLLDQNYYDKLEDRYKSFVPKDCKLFLGPKYILLRDEFLETNRILSRNKRKNRIFIFFGAIDQFNLTLNTLKSLHLNNSNNFIADIVIGKENPNKQIIKDYVSNHSNLNLYVQIDNFSEILENASICIGSGGTAIWESCFLGIPSFIITFAENQILSVEYLASKNIIEYYGHHDDIELVDLSNRIFEFLNNSERLKILSQNCVRLVDGLGKNRIIKKIKYD